MLEAAGLAGRVAERLRVSPDWDEHAFCLEGTIALQDDSTTLVFDVDHGAISVRQGPADDTRVTITGAASGWQRLGDPAAINATLNRLFREGDLDVRGDMDFAFHHWPELFWLIDAVRAALVDSAA